MSNGAKVVRKRSYRILHTLPDLKMGGGQKCVLNNVIYLNRERFVNYVCYFLPYRDMEPVFVEEGITPFFLHHRGFWSWPGILFGLVRFIREQQIDLVHIQGPPVDKLYAQIAALVCRVPVVRTLQGVKPEPTALYRLLRRPRPRQLYRTMKVRFQWALDCLLDPLTVRHVIAVSDSVRESWRSYLRARGIREGQVTVSHNAISVEKYTAPQNSEVLDSLRRDLGVHGAYPVLINIARLTPGKGQELLIEMMSFVIQRWPGTKLLLIGEGDHRVRLQRAIRDADLEQSVLMLGQMADIAALLAISDVFVFSSFFEGFPLTVLEAMAAGKPVVAIQLPPLRELQNEGTEIRLVEQRSARALAGAVSEIVEDREQAYAIGKRGQQVVTERYSMAGSVKRLEAVYSSVLEGGGVKDGA